LAGNGARPLWAGAPDVRRDRVNTVAAEAAGAARNKLDANRIPRQARGLRGSDVPRLVLQPLEILRPRKAKPALEGGL